MVDVARAMKTIAKLTALKFFPTDPTGQKAVVEIAAKMATTNEQIDWVVAQMLVWYNEWPGPKEMRGVFCQRWKPADGGPNISVSQVFEGGIFPGCQAASGAGVPAISKAEAVRLLAMAAEPLPEVAAATPIIRPKVTPIARTPQIITQADIDKAEADLRRRKEQEHARAAQVDIGPGGDAA